MFTELFNKFSTFAEHHQTLIALIIGFAVVCLSWGVEKVLEKHLEHFTYYGYIFAIIIGLLLLWITKHYILHVM